MKDRKKNSPSMRVCLILLIIGEFLLIILCAWFLLWVLHHLFSFTKRLPDIVWLIIIGAALACMVTTFLVKFLFKPISRLGKAMQQVAEGNFDVRLDEKKGFSEIRQINEDFNFMTKQLASTEILQTNFISNVSHDFKTPINAIEGYATLLQGSEESASPEQKTYIQKILFNTRRLTHLVGNILLLSKVDNQAIQSRTESFRLDEQIRQAILSLESLWERKETEFDVDLENVEYEGSEVLLMHVWTNLIENAVKYGPQGGMVRLKLIERADGVTFTIDDEGPGIRPEAQKHIFDRFYQEDNSREKEGNGLGLALVRRILKLTGGTIGVENLPEKGCRFTVQLPVNQKE